MAVETAPAPVSLSYEVGPWYHVKKRLGRSIAYVLLIISVIPILVAITADTKGLNAGLAQATTGLTGLNATSAASGKGLAALGPIGLAAGAAVVAGAGEQHHD